MLPKVKAQKTRLSNYLVEELGAKLQKSQSTNSEYFTIGTIKIRISDHTDRHSDSYLNIFIPFNDPNSFIIENNFTISILKSLKEVKSFLHSLLFIQKLYNESLSESNTKKLLKEQQKVDELRQETELLSIRNTELQSMINTRNKAITELAQRAKAAEELALSDPKNIVEKKAIILNKGDFVGDVIIINGKAYPLTHFPQNFKVKVYNIINNSNLINPVA